MNIGTPSPRSGRRARGEENAPARSEDPHQARGNDGGEGRLLPSPTAAPLRDAVPLNETLLGRSSVERGNENAGPALVTRARHIGDPPRGVAVGYAGIVGGVSGFRPGVQRVFSPRTARKMASGGIRPSLTFHPFSQHRVDALQSPPETSRSHGGPHSQTGR